MNTQTRIHRLIKQGGIRELCKGILRYIYWHSNLRTARYAIGYKLSGSPVSKTIGDTSVSFHVSNSKEFARTKTVYGEHNVIFDVLETLSGDDVFYDVGANIGTYTCFVGNKVNPGNTIAFEPHPGNVRRLKENLDMNKIEAEIYSVALSNEHGSRELSVAGTNNGAGGGTHTLSTDENSKTININVIEGDRLIKNGKIDPPSVIKIDVEGAEQLVLEGLTNTLKTECRVVYCEVHPDRLNQFGSSEKELKKLLRSLGYSLQIIEDRSPEYFIKAVRNK